MKIRIVYTGTGIVSVDKPLGAAAIDYDRYNLVIDEHNPLLQRFFDAGLDVSKISEFLIQEGIAIEQPEWMPKPIIG